MVNASLAQDIKKLLEPWDRRVANQEDATRLDIILVDLVILASYAHLVWFQLLTKEGVFLQTAPDKILIMKVTAFHAEITGIITVLLRNAKIHCADHQTMWQEKVSAAHVHLSQEFRPMEKTVFHALVMIQVSYTR